MPQIRGGLNFYAFNSLALSTNNLPVGRSISNAATWDYVILCYAGILKCSKCRNTK